MTAAAGEFPPLPELRDALEQAATLLEHALRDGTPPIVRRALAEHACDALNVALWADRDVIDAEPVDGTGEL